MIAELVVLVVVIICMGYLYLKGSVLKSIIFFFCALLASFVALSFFEMAGKLLVGYGYGGQWIFAAPLILIFAITLIVLLAIAEKLEPLDLTFSDIADRVGRCIVAIPAGLVIAGVLLIAVNLSPLPSKWPYARFDAENKNARPDQPDKSLIFNADGFTAGLCSIVSKGSMAGSKSIAVFHPQLVNELALNRVRGDESNAIIAGFEAIRVIKAYYAPEQIAESIPNKSPGTKPVIVQAEIKNSLVKEGGALLVVETGTVTFTMGQVRLMCSATLENYKGKGEVIFPAGFLKSDGKVEAKPLLEEIKLPASEFRNGTTT
ncbi:MAG: hypothetical protein ABFD79_12800, partial [Phycisphaerales bacterium]